MYSAYKKLTAQDIGQVPFNAHKQYSFNSSSFSQNSFEVYDTIYSSASLETFSTGALNGVYPKVDTYNSLRYFQLDHLFYKDFKLNLNKRLGHVHYLKHKRELYEKSKIISIPNGLCGSRIKPTTFILSASNHNISGSETPYHKVVDDSYGNLYLSSSILSDYNTDIRTNILRIGPEKGFQDYDLNILNDEFEAGLFYRRGKKRLTKKSTFTKPHVLDDSYFFNLMNYKNVTFSPQKLREGTFSGINFNGTNSGIYIENDEKFHFNPGDDFTITLWADISQSSDQTSYLISKSTTRTVIPSTTAHRNAPTTTYTSGALQTKEVPSSPQYPFEIYSKGSNVYFSRSDGDNSITISAPFITSSINHLSCRLSSSKLEIFVNGVGAGTSGSEDFKRDTQNNANIYIGNKGETSNYLSGSLSQINIYEEALTDTQIANHYSSSNGSPYVGNIFYESGLATITHPNYQNNISLDFIGWDLSTIFHITSSETLYNPTGDLSSKVNPTGMYFKPDGTKVFVCGEFRGSLYGSSDQGKITEYVLGQPWKIETATTASGMTAYNSGTWNNNPLYLNTSQSLIAQGGAGEKEPNGVFIRPDGRRMWFIGETTNKIYQYNLGTEWSITSSVYHASSSISSAPRDLSWKPDGTRLYICDTSLEQIFQYNVPKAWDITSIVGYGGGTITAVGQSDFSNAIPAGIGSIEGFSIKPDGKTLFLVELGGTDKIHEFTLNTPWTMNNIGGVANVANISTNTIIESKDSTNKGVYVREDGEFLYIPASQGDNIDQYALSSNNKNNFHLKFQGTHLIFENEYQCTIEEHEFNYTMNPSTRKNRNLNCQELSNFSTGSNFKPYVTTVGLYNEEGEMLVVGKLGQPTRMSDETDTTIVIRWDN